MNKYLEGRDYIKGRPVRAGGYEGIAEGTGLGGELLIRTPAGQVSVSEGRAAIMKSLPHPLGWPLVLIDTGNTYTKVGKVAENGVILSLDVPTAPHSTLVERTAAALEGLEPSGRPAGAAVSCVVPEVFNDIISYFNSECGPVVYPGEECLAGLTLRVRNPARVGADRISNACAAFHYYGRDAVIADLGTANTFDVVSAGGEFLGGLICPGVSSMTDALASRAACLDPVVTGFPEKVIGDDTSSSMKSGVYCTLRGQIEASFNAVRNEWGRDFIPILTGGATGFLHKEFLNQYVVDCDITLKGLIALWNSRNT